MGFSRTVITVGAPQAARKQKRAAFRTTTDVSCDPNKRKIQAALAGTQMRAANARF
jgi:hypothetical protein